MGSGIALAVAQVGFAIMGGVAAWHQLRLARSSRAAGEDGTIHAVVGAMICIAGVGILLFALGRALGDQGGPWPMIAIVGNALERVSVALVALFAVRVFRPAAAWSHALAGALIGALVIGFVLSLTQPDWPVRIALGPISLFSQASFAAPFVWAMIETLSQWRRASKQRELGLAEPMVCHRFLLWGLAMAALVCVCGLGILVNRSIETGNGLMLDVGRWLSAVAFTVVALSVYLSFHAPQWYVRAVAGARG